MDSKTQIVEELQLLRREYEASKRQDTGLPTLPNGKPDYEAVDDEVVAGVASHYIVCLIAELMMEEGQINSPEFPITSVTSKGLAYPSSPGQIKPRISSVEAITKARARYAKMLKIPLGRTAKASDIKQFLRSSVMSSALAKFIDADLSTLPLKSRQ